MALVLIPLVVPCIKTYSMTVQSSVLKNKKGQDYKPKSSIILQQKAKQTRPQIEYSSNITAIEKYIS